MRRVGGIGQAAPLLLLIPLLALGASCASAVKPAARLPASAPGGHPSGSPRESLRRMLAPALDRLFDSRPFNRSLWGVEIVDLRSGETLYERNPQRHFIPASNMKLLVTSAALEKLGPDYTYRTSLYTNGEIRDGTLVGDLILYGRGDPNISGRYTSSPTAILADLAASLRERGIRRVEGRVVADESFFDADYTRPDWATYDLLWWYAAPVSALSFNDNSIDFTIRPGPAGWPPIITGSPATRFYTLSNTARTVAQIDSASVPLDFTRLPGSNQITAYGELAADAKEDTQFFAVVNPAAYTATVFLETLEGAGIQVANDSILVVSDPALSVVDSSPATSGTEPNRPGPAAEAGRPEPMLLAEHVSPPLEKVILSINQRSQNWHAEQLLKTLGKVVLGKGSFDAGIAVERDVLRSIGIEPDAVYIRDASGLSTGNLITPHAIVTLLGHMLHHPHGDVFFASLPVAGGESSLRSRFSNGPAAGAVHAKTGSIQHVNSLSGYLVPTPADTLAFSILANNHGLQSSQAIAAIDSAVTIVTSAYQR